MAIAQNFPNIRPSLNLSFALTKALDPRITYARASAATYYGTETAKAEENLLIRSQEFETAWGNTGTTDTANSTTAPDGTTTADTVTETTATSSHNVNQAFTPTSGLSYVFSVFVKKGDGVSARNFIQLGFPNTQFGSNSFANFNIDSGTVTFTGAGLTSASIVSAGNNWYRCIIIDTAVASTAANAVISLITTDTAANQESYTGTTDANIFLWGAQLEQRDAVTNYTPTTNQPITNFVPVLESAAAGEARFDHNPVTGESLGLLIEESRTNLILRSEEFQTTWTTSDASITANTIVAPSGELTGDKLVENAVNNVHLLQQAISFTSGTSYAYSVYLKAGERTLAFLVGANTTTFAPRAFFDLSAGTVVAAFSGTATIEPVGNGWYRCTVSGSAGATATTNLRVVLVDTGTNATYTGDGFSGIFIWGASLEQGGFPTSYVKTTTAQVTRAADAASMTGANFSSWFNQAEGGFLAAYSRNSDRAAGNQISMMISDGTGANTITIADSANGLSDRVLISTNGASQMNTGSINYTANQLIIRSIGYKIDDCATSANGAAVVTDTSALIPVVNQLAIGFAPFFTASRINGHIRKIAYYPRRLANAELQGLTT